MLWLSFLIPVVAILICCRVFPHELTWWEILLPFIVPVILCPTFYYLGQWSQTVDTERYGNIINYVTYYEDWNEKVTYTVTVSDSNGKSRTETRTRIDYHPAKWRITDNQNTEHVMSKKNYKIISKKFGNSKFVDLHRWSYTNDGDKYVSKFDGTEDKLEMIFSKRTYTNKVQASKGVFSFPNISEEEIETFGLYEYPEITNKYHDSAILGNFEGKQAADKILQKFNAKRGAVLQIRVWVLIFENQPLEAAFAQESLWKGGNKNEFVICLGTNGGVEWCKSFCWSPDGHGGNDVVKSMLRDEIEDFEFAEFAETATSLLEKNWKRKEFSEFDYLRLTTPIWSVIVTWILTIAAVVGVCFFAVANDMRGQ